VSEANLKLVEMTERYINRSWADFGMNYAEMQLACA
jgi:hypothetical protein